MAAGLHASLFDTAFGRCALAWSEQGLTAVRLPAASDAQTLAALTGRSVGGSVACDVPVTPPSDWPDFVHRAVADIQAHLLGQPRELLDLPLDMSGTPDFERRVWLEARKLAPGQTCTYGELARELGEPGAMRAVGQALGHNPWPLVVPCHRVLAAGGKLGGFSAPGGSETKRRLLVLEAGMVRREGQLF
ncbi:MAG: methylated-DNA--[protein]-cysteine S-methyltransferase [Rubrivivax sp.]|nr:methylated-DNA--[protein]-cysteine S-methyltransferase [Rubrivivax sp.]MDP3612150.1 methylated-DNA--[protein]-cysteine S-methyltransferase [Rubrivivax sp.]